MLFPGEHAQTVVAFANPARFVPCVSKGRVSAVSLLPVFGAAWLLILLCFSRLDFDWVPGVAMMASDDGVWSSDNSAVNTGWLCFPEEDVV